MLARGLVVRAVAAEVGSKHEAVVDEDLERPVDGGRVDAREALAHAFHDLLRAQMPVRLGEQHVPDHAPLAGEPPPVAAQGLVVVHEPIITPVRTGPILVANELQ